MATFATYYDTSGTGKSPLMVTVGLLGSERRWLSFEEKWRKMLVEFKVPYIHMKELTPNKPPFDRFLTRTADKKRLFQRCLSICRSATVFAMAVDVKDYDEVNDHFQLGEVLGAPFALCVGTCVDWADQWHRNQHPQQPIEHFHEDGDGRRGNIVMILKNENKLTLHFKPKVDPTTRVWFVPFQATDFLAWELRRGASDVGAGKRGTQLRRSFVAIIDKQRMHKKWKYIDKDVLLRACKRFPEKYPPRT